MKIQELNYTPNFGARIKIQKKGFQNIVKDVVDSSKSGGRCLATTASGAAEVTSFPADSANNHSLINVMSKNGNKMTDNLEAISNRNIKTSQIENPKAAADSAISTAGAGTISSGVGSYYGSAASAMDQSANYPNASFPLYSYEHSMTSGGGSAKEIVQYMENSAYEHLYDPALGKGNEMAGSYSTTASSLGVFSQYAGSTLLKGKKGIEELERKLPS